MKLIVNTNHQINTFTIIKSLVSENPEPAEVDHGYLHALSPGQTDSQVVGSSKLGSTCDSIWPRLECTCDDLQSLWSRSKFARKSMQVFNGLATQRKSLRKFNLPLLASLFDQGLTDALLRKKLQENLKVCENHFTRPLIASQTMSSTTRIYQAC